MSKYNKPSRRNNNNKNLSSKSRKKETFRGQRDGLTKLENFFFQKKKNVSYYYYFSCSGAGYVHLELSQR